MTLLFRDPLFQQHNTGRHPESAKRLIWIERRLKSTGLAERCEHGTFKPLEAERIARVHAPEVAIRAEAAARKQAYLDGDTPTSAESYRVALAAAGAGVAAVDAVMTGRAENALCLVRPPGHHARPQHSMGFCLFNNIALAARHAQDAFGLTRILIVDWDVHHGNGTQDVFYEDPVVSFLSIHRYGHGFYPGTGAEDETGSGRGLGLNRNVALPHGTSRQEFRSRFRNALEEAADRIKPELILLSAGFDAHYADPIGALGLETEDFAEMTNDLRAAAQAHCAGRIVSLLEGGYNLDMLAESVEAHLRCLLEKNTPKGT